jgi:hypothetical protein
MAKIKKQTIHIPEQLEMLLNGLIEDFTEGYKLVRKHDNLTKLSKDIYWIEFNEEGRFKAKHEEPAVERSLIMSPFNAAFTWQTTIITELLEVREDYVHFKTQNSEYELFKIIK